MVLRRRQFKLQLLMRMDLISLFQMEVDQMSDIGGIKKFINSNVTGDPMNCLLYINSIESEGENSYILH